MIATPFKSWNVRGLRYCGTLGWLHWDGARWAADGTGEVERRAKNTVGEMYKVLPAIGDMDIRARLAKHATSSESANRIRAMIRLAESEPGIAVRAADLDTDPWLLNVLNGTIDLRTGELRPHRREDLCTKVAPVEYWSDAESARWDTFLSDVFDGNGALIDFAQRAVGAALCGSIRDHVAHILCGCGANGKSTFTNILLAAMGDYAITAPPKLLIQRRNDQHPAELAILRGVRLVVSEESGEGCRLDEDKLKMLTGGTPIRARHLHKSYFEFDPSHTVMLCTNHKPRVRGQDHGIWRRLKLWPFTRCFTEDKQDRALGEKLERELSAILAWAVRGCLAWQSDGGLRTPDVVAAATESYRQDEDDLGEFIADHCTTGDGLRARTTDLHRSYMETTGSQIGARSFVAKMKARGFEIDRHRGTGGARYWIGIRMLSD